MKKIELAVRKHSPIYRFAGECRVNYPRFSGIIKGKISPNPRELERIGAVLSITPNEVLSLITEEA